MGVSCPSMVTDTAQDRTAEEVRALRRVAWLVRKGLLAQMREEAGLSQSDVARFMGIAPSNVSRWESGTARPRADRAVELLRLLEEP